MTKWPPPSPLAGLAVFGLLAGLDGEFVDQRTAQRRRWRFTSSSPSFHSVLPVAAATPARRATHRAWAGHFFPPLALVLVLVPIFKLAELSFIVWPFVLLVDVLAIALAVLTATLLPVLVVLLLTLAATGALIFKIPAELTGLPTSFFLLGAFAVFFVAVSVWLVRKFKPEALAQGDPRSTTTFCNRKTLAALLPGVFGRAAVPAAHHGHAAAAARESVARVRPGAAAGRAAAGRDEAVLAGLAARRRAGLRRRAGMRLALQPVRRREPQRAADLPLAWYLVFFAVFAAVPVFVPEQFGGKVVPWAAAALAGLPQFLPHPSARASGVAELTSWVCCPRRLRSRRC